MLTIGNPKDEGSVGTGVSMGLGLNVGLFVLLLIAGGALLDFAQSLSVVFFGAAGGIGLTQLAYVIPMYLRYRKTGLKKTATGLVIAASITALLNASCWGVVSNMRF